MRVFLLLFAVGCAGAPERAPAPRDLEDITYHVRVGDRVTDMSVTVCFRGSPPIALVPSTSLAPELVTGVGGTPVEGARRIEIRGSACVSYQLDVERAVGSGFNAQRRGNELLVAAGLVLWQPATASGAPVTVDFEVPEGLHVSVPWARDGEHFRPSDTLFRLSGTIAFVAQPPDRFEVGGVSVEVARVEGPLLVDDQGIERWLSAAVSAVSGLYGEFPAPRIQFVLVPSGPGSSPVAFGMVRRGGGASVLLLPHATATEEQLTRDWTAVHEATHLATPRMHAEDAWLSEGFATYYQEVLRMRAGLQSPQEGWARVVDGFRRGEIVGTGRTLREEARDMRETRAFRRVYWQGTAFHLELDVALRRSGRSLDESVGRAQERWNEQAVWSGDECYGVLDRSNGGAVAAPLMDRYAAMTNFPDLADLLTELGIEEDGDVVRLNDQAPLAAIRRAIEAPFNGGSSR